MGEVLRAGEVIREGEAPREGMVLGAGEVLRAGEAPAEPIGNALYDARLTKRIALPRTS